MNETLWLVIANQLAETQSLRKKYEAQENDLKEQLKNIQKNTSYQKERFAFVIETRKGSINYKDIPQLQGVDLDKYRGENIDSWRFKLLW